MVLERNFLYVARNRISRKVLCHFSNNPSSLLNRNFKVSCSLNPVKLMQVIRNKTVIDKFAA